MSLSHCGLGSKMEKEGEVAAKEEKEDKMVVKISSCPSWGWRCKDMALNRRTVCNRRISRKIFPWYLFHQTKFNSGWEGFGGSFADAGNECFRSKWSRRVGVNKEEWKGGSASSLATLNILRKEKVWRCWRQFILKGRWSKLFRNIQNFLRPSTRHDICH